METRRARRASAQGRQGSSRRRIGLRPRRFGAARPDHEEIRFQKHTREQDHRPRQSQSSLQLLYHQDLENNQQRHGDAETAAELVQHSFTLRRRCTRFLGRVDVVWPIGSDPKKNHNEQGDLEDPERDGDAVPAHRDSVIPAQSGQYGWRQQDRRRCQDQQKRDRSLPHAHSRHRENHGGGRPDAAIHHLDHLWAIPVIDLPLLRFAQHVVCRLHGTKLFRAAALVRMQKQGFPSVSALYFG
mmetsp:Transcript_120655/g.341156  ORF Transcript_120655/g.341156 Transcript_120655/m.341156 type:complete len:242 (-) Transcript_120655:100-825(-)